jgi:hypothetical protein
MGNYINFLKYLIREFKKNDENCVINHKTPVSLKR